MSTHRTQLLLVLLFTLSLPARAVRVGEPAPDFTASDSNGQSHTLSAYRGKFVVLEWHNRDCPYTRKQYESGNMEKLQQKWTMRGVEWFTVISSAPGKQGYVTAAQENAYVLEVHAAPSAVLLDPEGKLGRLYQAKTTPHMFIIDPNDILIYNGAIDDKPTTDLSDIAAAHNYVDAALEAALAGRPVEVSVTRPYGCSVKYPD
ncbi:MAG TPA: redoxin domain-containing protein [Terriglobia bacterium]